ncbi:hypothetical protein CY34DRAFT_38563, partial [Suillus luteus UH-Slu-Lm8-n1]
PDGQRMISGSWDEITRQWDVKTGKEITVGTPFKGHTSFITGLTLSFNQTLLASASWDNTIKLW